MKLKEKNIIWSNMNLQIGDWKEYYRQYLVENEIEGNPEDENEVYAWMLETNDEYILDERINLDIQLSQPIIVIGNLGRWNGRFSGYKMIESGNIKDCLYSSSDYVEWYVDKYGDLRATESHHDGTNYLLYRVVKDGVTDTQIENLQNKIYEATVTRADITRLTRRLGDEIANVYGFQIYGHKKLLHNA